MPSNKIGTLAKRQEGLRRALTSGASKEAITRAAEHVRDAQLAILKKAESGVAPAAQQRGSAHKATSTIQRERKQWLDASVAEIISSLSDSRHLGFEIIASGSNGK